METFSKGLIAFLEHSNHALIDTVGIPTFSILPSLSCLSLGASANQDPAHIHSLHVVVPRSSLFFFLEQVPHLVFFFLSLCCFGMPFSVFSIPLYVLQTGRFA